MTRRLGRTAAVLLCAAGLAGCGAELDETMPPDADEAEPTVDGDLWQSGDAEEPPEPGKADAVLGTRTLPISADASSTAVWSVSRQWSAKVDVDFAPYFRKADNISWNEAYARFVAALRETVSAGGYKTYELTTPWGRTLPIAALECAEQAMFARITFAAWFKLPFFMEAIDGSGTRVFAGHFGFRTAKGVYRNFPEFKTAYADHSATAKASAWPRDARLRTRKLGGDDDQAKVLGVAKASFGAYLDEIHANKRAGHFTALLLVFFGSVNLADPANSFHVKPEGLRAGDVLLERWQRAGIGHALNVKRVEKLASGKLAVEVASGSMPRRQSLWEGPVTSRDYFLQPEMGGPGQNYDGQPYAALGGGLRRWRVAVVYNGGWTNVVPGESAAFWINSTDRAAIAARPAAFAALLEVPDPAVRRAELSAALAAARQYQRERPASCSNRAKREAILLSLADLEAETRYWSRARAENEYRAFEDYVFPRLAYDRSKVCCFNSSTAAMGDVAIRYNVERQQASAQCLPPVPFTSENIAVFKAWAEQRNLRASWVDWRADEPCPQQRNAVDSLDVDPETADYCALRPVVP